MKESPSLHDWHRTMAKHPLPHAGCFEASYPSGDWQEVGCVETSHGPQLHKNTLRPPQNVGATNSYMAQFSAATIGIAEGSFASASGITTESESGFSNRYSLQLNTNFIAYPRQPSLCSGAKTPTACQGAEQFIFESTGLPWPLFQPPGGIYIQYWLKNYENSCPGGWNPDGNDCFKNGFTAGVATVEPITNLGNLVVRGNVSASGDSISFTDGSGFLWVASDSGSVLGLYQSWNMAEFNVFGDGNSTQASFGGTVTLVPQIGFTLVGGATGSPICNHNGQTLETNNLNLVPASCCPMANNGSSALQFTETNPASVVAPFCLLNDITSINALLF